VITPGDIRIPCDNVTTIEDRVKRGLPAVLGLAALPLAIAATAMGLFSTSQLDHLKTEMAKISQNQERVFDIVTQHQSILQEVDKRLLEIDETVKLVLKTDTTRLSEKLTRLDTQLNNQLRILSGAIQAAQLHRLSSSYLEASMLKNLFKKLKKTS